MKRFLVAVFAAALALGTSVPVFADQGNGTHDYLALGDSVAFGFRPPDFVPTPDYFNAASFVGYPEMVAATLGMRDSNASCSGEATGGFIDTRSPDDNGCTTSYRLHFPLHVDYKLPTSQLQFALSFLMNHRTSTKLVTIDLGANDVFHCQNVPTSCPGGIAEVLATNQKNLETIFAALRATGYHNKIVALTYYALVYDAAGADGAQKLNQPMINAAALYHVRIASGFDAFAPLALATPTKSTCQAGLTIFIAPTPAEPAGRCDVHPTALGHSLLAAAIVQTAFADEGGEG